MIDASGKNDKEYGINHNAAFAQGLLENLTLALHPRALSEWRRKIDAHERVTTDYP